jgi:hypothetical protein
MDDEGMTTPSHPHRLAQPVYMPDQQITALPLQQINGKEICAAGMARRGDSQAWEQYQRVFYRMNMQP